MAVVGPHAMAVLRTHMQWQFLRPHAMVVQEQKCYALRRDHIRLSVLRTTCKGTIYGCQFLGPHAITLLGPTCEGSCWDHIRMEVLENTCNLISGDNRWYYCWGTRRCQFWWLHAISVLGTTSYTGVNLKSPPSGVRILNCHAFSYRA